ncbi:MAG: hypothetical protein D6737_07695 [Chloroflexi bacterium]|nr:MAG: hypothetical protein CUN54_06490 [Phototrophicales bacterium]RMF80559.1 MAG: hypothetical protein D6737_07695 [Chloroflexota bacterium]
MRGRHRPDINGIAHDNVIGHHSVRCKQQVQHGNTPHRLINRFDSTGKPEHFAAPCCEQRLHFINSALFK